MAAAYQTGTATSPTDLLQTLVTWLVAQGWTSNMSKADGNGWRAHLSKSGTYINLRSTLGGETTALWGGGVAQPASAIGIGLYVGTGYNGASAWNAQAGGPIGNGQAYTVGEFMQIPVGSIQAYHFFDDGAGNIVVVVERTAGLFTHMGWGPSLVKAGAWTGGAYFFGAISGYRSGLQAGAGSPAASAYCPLVTASDDSGSSVGHIRADVDAFTGKWIGLIQSTTPSAGHTGKNASGSLSGFGVVPVEIPNYTVFALRLTSAMNTQANLVPPRIYVARDAGGYSLLGEVPNIFVCNGVGNGFTAGTVYSLGSDNYMLFPNFAVLKKA